MFFRATALTPAELMSALDRHPLTVSPDTPVLEAIAQMSGNRAASIAAEVSIGESHWDGQTVQGQTVHGQTAHEQTAHEQIVQTLRPQSQLAKPASCVLVVENDRVVGILTQRDVVRLTTQRLPLDQLVMRQVMIHPVITVHASIFTDLVFTVGLFQQHQIRHLPILDDHDRLVGLLTHEAALIASKKRFRQIVENTLEGVWVIDAEDRTSYVNPRMAEMLGYEVSEMVGRSVFEFMDQADRQIAATNIERRKNGIAENHDCRFKTKTGKDLWTLIATNPLYDEAGTYMGALIMLNDISDRKQTEARLRESEQRYTSLTTAAPIGVFRADAAGYCIYVNERWCQITGLTLEAARGQGWQQCLHPDDRQRVIDEWRKSVQENRPCQIEYRLQRPDGTTVWVYTKSAAETDVNGVVISYIGTVIDISDRKKSEEALRTSEAHQRALISAMPDLIMRVNREGIYLEFIATSNFPMLGEPNDLIGTHLAETFPPDLVQQRMEAIHCALDTHSIQIYEQTLYFKGQVRTEEVRIVPYSEDEVLTLVRDISDRAALEAERKQAETALIASEARWQFALEGAGDGVWDWNAQTNQVFFSRQWKAMLGYEEAEIDNDFAEWDSRVHPDDKDQCYAALNQHFSGQMPIYQNEHRMRCKDGSYKWILNRGKVIARAADGQPLRVIGTHTDISDRKQTELALAESERSLSTLISNLPGYVYRVQNDRNYTPEFISSGVTAITGYEPREYLVERSTSCGQEIHPDDAAIVWNMVQTAIDAHQAYECEYRIITKTGEEKWVWERGRAIYSEQDELLCLEGFVTEITDRKKAERQLQNLIQGTAAATGKHFFPALAQHIAVALDVSYALVSEQVDDTLRALAFWADGALQPTFSFPSLQTPCERTIRDGKFYCERCVQQQFPNDRDLIDMEAESYLGIALQDSQGQVIGSLCILNKQMIQDPQRAEGLLQVFAARASAELERERATQALEQLNRELETKVAERTDALQASEEQFQAFMSHSPTVAFIQDESGRLVYVNRVCEKLFGLPQSELIGKTGFDFLPPEIAQSLHDNDRQIMTSGQPVERIETVPNSIGDRRDWLVLKFPLPRSDGQRFLGGVGIDISDRKKAELALQESQRFIQQIADASPNVLYLYDIQEKRNLYTNRETLAVLGYSAAEIQAMGASFLQQVMHPDDLQRLLDYSQQLDAAHDSEILEFEYRMRHADGEWRWFYSRDTIFSRDEQGHVKQIIGTAQDISDRKNAEIALQAKTEELDRFFSLALDLLCFADTDGHFIRLNSQWEKTLGYPLSELEGSLFFDYVHPDDIEITLRTITHLQEGRAVLNFINRYRCRDGSYRWLEWRATPKDQLIYAAARDITGRQQAEAELQRTNEELARATRLKDEFLANMSHELRTPLNAVLGMTEVLLEQAFGQLNDRQIKALQTIERSGSHLLELINDILDVAKIESGQITLEFTSTAVVPLCLSSLTFIRQQAMKKRIQIQTQLPEDLPKLFVDERRIRQVLINLLNNAVKFTPEGGQITLAASYPIRLETTFEEQNFLRIAISDTGIGIAPENLPKLFRPFVQIDSALNRRYQGTGLGLALVKRLVDLHGGEVGITSELGIGSCFTIDLPCAGVAIGLEPQFGYEVPLMEESQTEQSTYPLILLAEDNESNITMISSYLEVKGYRLRLARNGREAVEMARSETPDLILMDIQMPEMNGLEATEQIRRDPNLANVPIIALTALAMSGDRDRCLAAGANEYLSKPIKLKYLEALLQQFLAKS